ncbi:hypothetical protein LCGC14_2713010 [marine sediment metagenome]|uniref:Uncharacterized protein n=1 Tax=marine sediment metagenome TaxID=412755 RepID=A0A0F9BLG5_9ZZZZ
MVEYFQENFKFFTEMDVSGKYVVIVVGIGIFFFIKYIRSFL